MKIAPVMGTVAMIEEMMKIVALVEMEMVFCE